MPYAPTSLQDLLFALRDGRIGPTDYAELTELPTFGGEEPADTSGIWSWDEESLLVGACVADFEVVSRFDVVQLPGLPACQCDDQPLLLSSSDRDVTHASCRLHVFTGAVAFVAYRSSDRAHQYTGPFVLWDVPRSATAGELAGWLAVARPSFDAVRVGATVDRDGNVSLSEAGEAAVVRVAQSAERWFGLDKDQLERPDLEDVALVRAACGALGVSQRELARRLVRDERTVRRWVSGEVPVPRVARLALARIVRSVVGAQVASGRRS